MPLLRWLGLTSGESAGDADGLAEVEQELDGLDRAQARYVACFAYLLGRVARADHEVDEAETRVMVRAVAEHAGLSTDHARLAVQIATARGLHFGGTEDYLVAREFESLASHEQKRALLHCLYAVSASDQSIRTVEDNEIRRIAAQLKLSHDEIIAVRADHLHHLASRRDPASR